MPSIKKVCRSTLCFAALLGVFLGCLYFYRGPLTALLVRTYLLPELESQGVNLSFSHLDTDLFSTVTMSGISLTGQIPEVATVTGDIAKATLHFNPVAFWHDPTGGLAAASLLVDGAALRYRISPHAKTGPPAADIFAIALPGLPYGLPALSLKRCNFSLQARDWRIDFDNLSSSGLRAIDGGRGGLDGSLSVGAIHQQGLPFFTQRREIKFDFVYRPGRLRFPTLTIGGKKVVEDVVISSSAAGLQASGSLDLAGGVVDFQLDGKGTMLQGSLQSRAMQATEVGALFKHPPTVHGTLTVHCSFRFDTRHPEGATAELRFNLGKGKVAQFPIDSLSAELALDNGVISGQKIALVSAANHAAITGLKTKLDDLLRRRYWDAFRKGTAEIKLSLGDWREFADLLPGRLEKALNDVQCRQLRLDGSLHDASLQLAAFSLQGTQLNVNLEKGTISLPADIRNWKSAGLSTDFSFGLEKISLIRPYLPEMPQHMEGRIQGLARLSGQLAAPTGLLSLTGSNMRYRTLPAFDFQAEAKLEKDAVQLVKLSATSGEDRLTAHGRLPFSSAGRFALKGKGQVGQVAAYADLFLPEGKVAGDLSFSLSALGDYLAPQGSVDVHSSRLAIAGQDFRDAFLSLSYDARTLTVTSSHFASGDAEFRVSGSITPEQVNWQRGTAELGSCLVSWHAHRLHLRKPVRITYTSQTFNLVESAHFDSDLGPLTVTGGAGLSRLDLKLQAAPLQLPAEKGAAPGKELAFAEGALSVTINGSIAAPSISGHGLVRRLRGAALPATFDGEVSFRYDDRGLELDTLELNGGPGGKVSLAGHLPIVFRQGSFQPLSSPLSLVAGIALPDATFLHQLFPGFIAKAGAVDGEIRLHGTLDRPLGNASFKIQGLQPAADNDWLPPGILTADLRLQAEENRLRIQTLRIEGQELDIAMEGLVNGNVSLADLLRSGDHKLAADLDLHGSLRLPKLAWLAERFSAFHRVDGHLAGDFSLSGPLQHPKVKGDFQISNGELRSSPELPALRELAGKISIDDSGVTFPSLTGLIGGAPAKASGRILFAGQKTPTFDLQFAGKNLLLYRTDGVKFRANADLTIQGSYLAPVIAGKLILTEGYYRKNIQLIKMITSGVSSGGPVSSEPFSLFSYTDAPMKDAKFSIVIRSEAPFTVSTNLLKGNLRPDLQLTGTGELPQLIGEIYVDNARCSLPAGTLTIDAGLLRFRQADPDRFFLELSGSAKMMGYDITAKITGPYDEPTIDLSSSPPLGNEELLLLLLTGQRPASSNTTGRSGVEISRVGVYLGRELLTSLFGKENIDDQSIMERLQINIGREITKQGDDTIEARFLLKNGLLTKNDSLYLTAEKDVWDDYNGGLRLIFRFP